MFKTFYLLVTLHSILELQFVSTQKPTEIGECQEYYVLKEYGGNFIGLITLPHITLGRTDIDVEFSYPQGVPTNSSVSIDLLEDEETIIYKHRQRKPITFQVSFTNLSLPPKLTRFAINDDIRCFGEKHPLPSTSIQLTHSVLFLKTNKDNEHKAKSNKCAHEPFEGINEQLKTLNHPLEQLKESSLSLDEQFHNILCNLQYKSYEDSFAGLIFLPIVAMGSTNIRLDFFQNCGSVSKKFGRISIYDDEETTVNKIKKKYPVLYRIDFEDSNLVRPKLNYFSFNGIEVCPKSTNRKMDTIYQLQHTLLLLETNDTKINNCVPPIDVRSSAQQKHEQVTCGKADPKAFIHGGSILSAGQVPWLAAIYKIETNERKFLCGGTLISTRTVISAAHCYTHKPNDFFVSHFVVHLGRHNLQDKSEEKAVTRLVENIFIHPDYNFRNRADADIAIFHLELPVSLSPNISPACLWAESDDLDLVLHKVGFVAGWGYDEIDMSYGKVPVLVDAVIQTTHDCALANPQVTGLLTPRTICAGNGDRTGPNRGDSGGGLVINRSGRWTLRGIVSTSASSCFGADCQEPLFVLYTDVAKHLKWVQQNFLP